MLPLIINKSEFEAYDKIMINKTKQTMTATLLELYRERIKLKKIVSAMWQKEPYLKQLNEVNLKIKQILN